MCVGVCRHPVGVFRQGFGGCRQPSEPSDVLAGTTLNFPHAGTNRFHPISKTALCSFSSQAIPWALLVAIPSASRSSATVQPSSELPRRKPPPSSEVTAGCSKSFGFSVFSRALRLKAALSCSKPSPLPPQSFRTFLSRKNQSFRRGQI